MADRTVATTNTLNYFRHEFNGTAEDDTTLREQQYSASSLAGFTAFQLKVVLTGTNSSYPPVIKDLRGIALAV